MSIRPPAVAGTWYPATAAALTRDVEGYLAAVPDPPLGNVTALIAPHAGLMFSGPVGAHAYQAASTGHYDVVVLVGPSHYVAFDGVALYPEGAFETPLGSAVIDAETANAIAAASPLVQPMISAHRREHSLEMQLPFLRHLLPDVPIVPLLMGLQVRETITALGAALASALSGRRALIVGSTDLSHFFDAATAASLDGRVRQVVAAFDPEAFLALFEQYPGEERGRFVACGGGPAISVLMAARALGASNARVLRYGHSGEISGDHAGVVGYMAAVMGKFD
jgi:AmmeMemoRadiSam system protein B